MSVARQLLTAGLGLVKRSEDIPFAGMGEQIPYRPISAGEAAPDLKDMIRSAIGGGPSSAAKRGGGLAGLLGQPAGGEGLGQGPAPSTDIGNQRAFDLRRAFGQVDDDPFSPGYESPYGPAPGAVPGGGGSGEDLREGLMGAAQGRQSAIDRAFGDIRGFGQASDDPFDSANLGQGSGVE